MITAFEAPRAQEAAEADFRRAADLGLTGLPTLLAVDGDRLTLLASEIATTTEVEQRLSSLPAH